MMGWKMQLHAFIPFSSPKILHIGLANCNRLPRLLTDVTHRYNHLMKYYNIQDQQVHIQVFQKHIWI